MVSIGAPPARSRLLAADVLTIGFAGALGMLAVAGASRVPRWPLVTLGCLGIVTFLLGVSRLRTRWGRPADGFLHDWAFAPIAYLLYVQVQLVVGPLHDGRTADAVLIAADRWIFGGDPGAWLARIATRWLTEILQICYTSFYALMISVGIELWDQAWREERAPVSEQVPGRSPSPARARFHLYTFSCALGFIISFVGYLLVPAVGPRFTIFPFASIERELPGLFLAGPLRGFVDAGGLAPGVHLGTGIPAAAARDVFPSGHTMMTLVAMYWACRFRLEVRRLLLIVGSLLIVGTVYLRYHYVVDVVAGAALAAVCVALTPSFHGWIARRFETLDVVNSHRRCVDPC